jgi:hypothetical protein
MFISGCDYRTSSTDSNTPLANDSTLQNEVPIEREFLEHSLVDESIVKIEVESLYKRGQWLFRGSGALIGKTPMPTEEGAPDDAGSTYSVLTAAHVLPLPNHFRIVANDSSVYEVDSKNIVSGSDGECSDISVLKFDSQKDYTPLKINFSPLAPGSSVYINGWYLPPNVSYENSISDNAVRQRIEGKLTDDQTNQSEYSKLTYKFPDGRIAEQGTSGAPIMNEEFEVMGVHSRRKSYLLSSFYGTPIHCLIDVDTFDRSPT